MTPASATLAQVPAHLARLVDNRDDLDFTLLATFDAGRAERLARHARVGDQDVDVGLATLGLADHALDVDAGVAQHFPELGQRARLVGDVDRQIVCHCHLLASAAASIINPPPSPAATRREAGVRLLDADAAMTRRR